MSLGRSRSFYNLFILLKKKKEKKSGIITLENETEMKQN